jgi:hypothetical protein
VKTIGLLLLILGTSAVLQGNTAVWNFGNLTPQQGVTSINVGPSTFYTGAGTTIDIVGPGGPCRGPESGTCIDLNGTAGPATFFTQISLEPNIYWDLSLT